MPGEKMIWTIGHSTHPLTKFMELLQQHSITHVADVRHFPGSRKFPWFNKEELRDFLATQQVAYTHFIDLGGRRKPLPGSIHTAWRKDAFRGYADYTSTDSFKTSLKQLEDLAKKERVAFMCSESVWWRCHRSLISDLLKSTGWTVVHIMPAGTAKEHPYTSAARIIDGKLTYSDPQLF